MCHLFECAPLIPPDEISAQVVLIDNRDLMLQAMFAQQAVMLLALRFRLDSRMLGGLKPLDGFMVNAPGIPQHQPQDDERKEMYDPAHIYQTSR